MLGSCSIPSGALSGVCDDTNLPSGLTKEELEDYAKRCGRDAAVAYLKEQTGVDVTGCVSTNADVDWECAAKAGISAYTGVSVDSLDIFDENGNIDFEASFELAGEIAAVAICTAYGAGAAAPICGAIGGRIGSVVYDIASGATETFKEVFGLGGKERRIFQPDAFNCAIQAQKAFAGAFDGTPQMAPGLSLGSYTARLFALRSMMLATIGTLDKLERDWPALAGQQTTKQELYKELVANGLQMPRNLWDKWRYLFAADQEGAWFDGTSPANTRYRVSRSVLAFVQTLTPRRPPSPWDISVIPGAESKESYEPKLKDLLSLSSGEALVENKYPYLLGGPTECVTPPPELVTTPGAVADVLDASVAAVVGATACVSPLTQAQYDAFRKAEGNNFDSGGPNCHWLIICGGDPVSLRAIEWNNVTVYDSFAEVITGGYNQREQPDALRVGGARRDISGHTVLYIASQIDVDYWCLLATDAQFEAMKTLWVKSLDASVKKTLAKARKQRVMSWGGVFAMKPGIQVKPIAVEPARGKGPGWGAWALAFAGLAGILGGGYALARRGSLELTIGD